MATAHLVVDPDRRIGTVSPRLFGSFVEHMGRCVYTGIYEPDHPSADQHGLRRDVLELVRELGVTMVRYPGGNFVSGYRWEDGVGPRNGRPVRRDLAWRSTETNQFGLDEFMRWAAAAEVEPMLALNLGTRGIQEALDLQEYATHPNGTALSDLRAEHGRAEPYDIRLWCLGNEMDGRWQTGHKTAHEYGRLAAETARALRQGAPQQPKDLTLVACGSSHPTMPTFGEWEATVLEEAYDEVDLISGHLYVQEQDGDTASFLAMPTELDRFIDDLVRIADGVGARLGRTKRIGVSIDEWNVWYLSRMPTDGPPGGWPQAPRLIEDCYNVADAVVVGGLLISLLRHADRVAAACQAQLVNVIAPIRTEPGGPSWRQTTFHPFALTARHARGDALDVDVKAPLTETPRFGAVPAVDAVATYDAEAGQAALFVVNRSVDRSIDLDIDVRTLGGAGRAVAISSCLTVADDDIRACNTLEAPDRVQPRAWAYTLHDGGLVEATLPPASWTVVTLDLSLT